MESVSIEISEVVWAVSVGFTEAGEFQDYGIEEIDLTDKSDKIVNLLKEKLGNGVFISYEAAEQWIAAKMSQSKGCCQKGKLTDNSNCSCPHGQACNNKAPI
jgi:hypothetical protein